MTGSWTNDSTGSPDLSPPYSDAVVPTPVYHDGHVASVGSAGCDLLKLSKNDDGVFDMEHVYFSRNRKNDLGGFVLYDGFIYDISDRRGWVCQNLESGDLEWYSNRVRGSLGLGSIVYADGNLILYAERKAEVAMIEATPDGYEQKGRFEFPERFDRRSPSGRNWPHSVIANGKLYLRDQELLFRYKINE